MPLVLDDTTVLNNFAQVGRQDLLQKAFPGLSAPRAVRAELSAGEELGLVPRGDWSWLQVIDLKDTERSRAAELEQQLQAGEAACLAVAEARGGFVLTDDSAARRLADVLHLQISGTIGALARLLRAEILTFAQAEAILTEMMTRGYRSPVRSLRELYPLPSK